MLRLVPAVEAPDSLEADDAREAVRHAVSELPGVQRDVLVLCEYAGCTMREAAEALGWGESRVKVTLHRARRRLREVLRGFVAGERVRAAREK